MSSVREKCAEEGFTFIWRIENYRRIAFSKETSISSTSFYTADLDTTWFLQFYPRGGYNQDSKSECNLRRIYAPRAISFNCKMCIYTTNGEILCTKEEINARLGKVSHTLNIDFDRLIGDSFPHETLILHCHLWETGSVPDTRVYCHTTTEIKAQKKIFEWKIPKFSSLLLKDENVFTLKNVEENCPIITFKLSLRGTSLDDASLHITIHFERIKRRTFFACCISLVDHIDTSTKFMSDEDWLESGRQLSLFPHFLTRRELIANKSSYLPDDVLSLKCELTISDGNHNIEQVIYGEHTYAAVNTSEERPSSQPQVSEERAPNDLRGDLGLFYDSGTLCDFKLSAGSRAFPVHSIILSARSPVFRAMFEIKAMFENATTSLDILDLDSDTLDRLLRYVYTDAVQDMCWEDASRLYFAADKYQLPGLKRQCSTMLRGQLDVSNAVKILALAGRHQDGDLKRAVQDFVFNCGRAAFKVEEWKLLEAENPQLVFETLRNLFYEKFLVPPLEMPLT